MTKTVKFRSKSYSLRYIKSDSLIKLVKIDYLNSAKLIQYLNVYLLPDMDESEIFQHDRAPYHRSWATQQANINRIKEKRLTKNPHNLEELWKFSYRK